MKQSTIMLLRMIGCLGLAIANAIFSRTSSGMILWINYIAIFCAVFAAGINFTQYMAMKEDGQ